MAVEPRHSRLLNAAPLAFVLCAAAASLATLGCDDDFSEVTRGALVVSSTGGGATSIAERGDFEFAAIRPNTTSDTFTFLLSNPNSEGDLRVTEIRFFTESPDITATLNNEPPSCSGDVCTFSPFTLTPLLSKQLEFRYAPTSDDSGCGAPPPSLLNPPDGYCAHAEILSDDPNRPRVLLVFSTVRLSGAMQVCLVDTNECSNSLSVDFNSAAVGDPAQIKRFTVNNVGASKLTVSAIEETLSPASDFRVVSPSGAAPPFDLEPEAAPVEFELTFEPVTEVETRSGNVVVRAANGDTAVIAVSVGNPNAAQAEVSDRELRFVNVQAPQSESRDITITNAGGPTAAPLTVNFVLEPSSNVDYSVTNDAGDPVAGPRCRGASQPASCTTPLVVPRQDSRIITVTYAPTTAQASNATLRLTTNDPDPADRSIEIDLIASGGVGFLTSDQPQLQWDAPENDVPESRQVVLTNEGNADVSITGFELRNVIPAGSESTFEITTDPTLPATLGPNDSVTATITFTRPTDDMIGLDYAADLAFLHDGANGQTIVSLRVDQP